MKIFDVLNTITREKRDIIDEDPENVKHVNMFMLNRALSQYGDCVLFANVTNMYPDMPAEFGYRLLLNTIRAKKRPFVQWAKVSKDEQEVIAAVKQYYGYSDVKAREAMDLLSAEQLQHILSEMTGDEGVVKNDRSTAGDYTS